MAKTTIKKARSVGPTTSNPEEQIKERIALVHRNYLLIRNRYPRNFFDT